MNADMRQAPPRTHPAPVPAGSDLLLHRERAAILAAILADRTGWTPDWQPTLGGLGHGLANIFAGHLELLQQRLAQVPDHRLAVMLDQLGVSLLPAQGARTHVLLTGIPGTLGTRVPAGTRFGALAPGRDTPVVFETQDTVAISSASIVEAHTVLPESDAEQDHSADLMAHRPVTLFADALAVERDLYVGHDTLLTFNGRAVVELEIGLAVAAPAPLALDWAWWDGNDWRQFTKISASAQEAGTDDSVDGTAGLTRSGTVRLVAPCAASVPLELDGRGSCWIRGRLLAPLQLAAGSRPPTLSRLRIRVVNEHRRLVVRRTVASGVGSSLRIWGTETIDSPKICHHMRDQSTATSTTQAAVNDNALVALPGTMTGHSIQVGVSPHPSRSSDPSIPLPPDDPRRVAFDSLEELTDPQIVDPGTVLDVTVTAGLPLDKAIADQRAADLSKTFAPLGPAPVRGTAFLFANATATMRPRSRVTLVLERPVTAAEEADGLSGKQEGSVKAAQELIAALVKKLEDGPASALGALASAKATLDPPLPTLLSIDPAGWYAVVRSTIQTALTALGTATGANHAAWGQVELAGNRLDDALAAANAKPLAQAARSTLGPTPREIARVLLGIATAAEELAAGGSAINLQRVALQTAVATGSDAEVAAAELALSGLLGALLGSASPFLPAGALPPIFTTDPTAFVATVNTRISGAKTAIATALTAVQSVRDILKNLNPSDLVKGVLGTSTTQLTAPVVAWEYHNGSRWRALGVEGDAQVLALQASGSLRFTVPDDIADIDIDGDVRRWLRARLAAGSFSHLRLVSWTDDKSQVINFLPVVEPRAPMLDSIQVFYEHRSEAVDPGGVIVCDNHDWRDLTTAVTWPGPGGCPFLPMLETAPTLYLGFDGELPADRISIWMQRKVGSAQEHPNRPLWEGFDGEGWVRLATDDGTDGLRRTGVVGLIWPGAAGAPGVAVSEAHGTRIVLEGRGAAMRFAPGERLLLADLQGQEQVVVASVDGEIVTSRAPISHAYSGARLRPSPPARFGVPRTWVRAVFEATLPAPIVTLTGMAAHAVEVAQVETILDELIGSGDGSPNQMLMSRHSPVAGDPYLEVRELDGDRADLDHDVLERTLQADGIDPQLVRLVHDSRTGRVSEVWVPWVPVPSLGSAGPTDRVYVIDHAQGRFIFGGRGHGRALVEGRDNTRLRSYRTCDGAVGNVQAHKITQVLSAVAVGDVTNPDAASGGADIEPLPAALARGPALLRHRRLALTERDVEAIAVECSPAVVRARAVGAADRFGRPSAGEVRVVIVPRDGTERPQPGAALLALVHTAIVDSSPVVAARHVTVEGPQYVPVGITVTVLPVAANDAGPVRERAQSTLEIFMHPLNGGPDGRGWEFGRCAHVSDIARVLESVPGVDAVQNLVLTRDDVPVGDSALIRPDQVVCAGAIVVRIGGA